MAQQQTKCPSCQAVWDETEIEYQQCDKCGYPIVQNPTNEFDSEIDDETMD